MRVISLGSFDLMHRGHVLLIKKCFEIGSWVGIGLNTDGFYAKYRGYKPVMTYKERYDAIKAIFPEVRISENDQRDGSAKRIIAQTGAKLIVVGSDWARKDYVGQLGLNWDWLDSKGIGICYVNYTKNISSSEIKNRCLSR